MVGSSSTPVRTGASCEEEERIEWTTENYEGIRDDVTGEPLDAELARKAQLDDIEYMECLTWQSFHPMARGFSPHSSCFSNSVPLSNSSRLILGRSCRYTRPGSACQRLS